MFINRWLLLLLLGVYIYFSFGFPFVSVANIVNRRCLFFFDELLLTDEPFWILYYFAANRLSMLFRGTVLQLHPYQNKYSS